MNDYSNIGCFVFLLSTTRVLLLPSQELQPLDTSPRPRPTTQKIDQTSVWHIRVPAIVEADKATCNKLKQVSKLKTETPSQFVL